MGFIFDRLMKRLGYDRYYIQGGDWGSLIGSDMATLFPHR
jgi:juvenile hormone epoxide hydrolase